MIRKISPFPSFPKRGKNIIAKVDPEKYLRDHFFKGYKG
jgi:hypothetical protein